LPVCAKSTDWLEISALAAGGVEEIAAAAVSRAAARLGCNCDKRKWM